MVSPAPSGRRLKMKDLEACTGVSRETIRFYIREGMLPEPERPHRNLAWYGSDHVERVLAIKRLQADRQLPLGVIRDLLDRADVRALAEGRGERIASLLPAMLDRGLEEEGSDPVETVALASGLSVEELRAMAAAGVLDLDDEDRIDRRDRPICEAWGRIRSAGFSAEDGFTVDQLREYQRRMVQIAELQVTTFMAGRGARGTGEEAARAGAEGMLLSHELFGALHVKAALEALRRGDGEGG
jgi:DNA-binding transcriptional MerR regulator